MFRAFARDLAAGRRSWDAETARFVTDLFDQLAPNWNSSRATGRADPLRDALERGGLFPDGPCLELGSGTGLFTPMLADAFDCLISMDLSEQMLRQAAGRSPLRVRADASRLPAADASIAAVDMLCLRGRTSAVARPGVPGEHGAAGLMREFRA
ncbi:class I SAM-dependent methyltransferase [Streptomyces coeruleorubidus]|uniref:class I SAM-dependent methyltransferase n=1 Tax=Streptomyces coeruleorubidus TaxID=116188 RepID=UPI0033A231FE